MELRHLTLINCSVCVLTCRGSFQHREALLGAQVKEGEKLNVLRVMQHRRHLQVTDMKFESGGETRDLSDSRAQNIPPPPPSRSLWRRRAGGEEGPPSPYRVATALSGGRCVACMPRGSPITPRHCFWAASPPLAPLLKVIRKYFISPRLLRHRAVPALSPASSS